MLKLQDKAVIFERESNLYTFSKDSLLKKNLHLHVFLPWKEKSDEELMFKIKKIIRKEGVAHIPFMEIDLSNADISNDLIQRLQEQLEVNQETHLIMSNMNSIHVLRIVDIISPNKVKSEVLLECFKDNREDYKLYFEVDDVFVFEVNHVGCSAEIENKLNSFVTEVQTKNIFKHSTNIEDIKIIDRWIDEDRNLTYDYFIQSSELEKIIYQKSWTYLSPMTQHKLVVCELHRQKGVFYRGDKKWENLIDAFSSYHGALVNELNEIYILPLVKAIGESKSLHDVWKDEHNSAMNPELTQMINELLYDDKKIIDSLDKLLLYFKHAKSFLFTIKNKFSKKIGKEEYLLIENFLIVQENLSESFTCHGLHEKISQIADIEKWVYGNRHLGLSEKPESLKGFNLKFSHLLKVMVSASYEDNIFFKLTEEKTAKSLVHHSFDEVVQSLIQQDLKKSA